MFLAYHETLVLKTGESATVIIAHTAVTGAAAAVLSLATAEGGRLSMVAARYIEEKYLNPLRAKRIKREEEAMKEIREEARAKGLALAQAHAKTLALGHALADAEWGAWNERRLAAEAKGEPFNEPTPATLRNRDRWQAAPGQDDAPPCGAEATSKTGGPLWVWGSPGRDPLWTQLTSHPCTATHDLPIMGRMNT